MKSIFAAIVFMYISTSGFSQHNEVNTHTPLWKGPQKTTEDTTSLLHAFKGGQVHGHFRYFFMATENDGSLKDYFANAAGGGIKFETAPFHGFQLGVSAFFVFNIGSSNLTQPDPKTNQLNRYERSLFDMEDPSNKSDIDRLEELYLKYNWKNSHITYGKQLIQTPFINHQDGRMRPTEVAGIWSEIHEIKNTKIEAGFLHKVSPRSTVEWYGVGESIGIYPSGVNADGTPSEYEHNLESKGIAMLGVTHQFNKNLSVKIWDVFTENIFNTIMIQSDLVIPSGTESAWLGGLQYVFQSSINDGGNEDQSKTYFSKGSIAQTFGINLGWKNERFRTSLNYNRITADGRFLMPREWGREPFYTFMPRERNDGLGDVHAYVLKGGYRIPKARFKTEIGLGYYQLPEVNNFALNKYGLPSYTQLNVDLAYEFEGLLKGLEADLLYVNKGRQGNTYNNDKYVINKVDMNQWNLVLNYHF